MTESNASYDGESNKLKCFRLRASIEIRWPAWNDPKLHKLKHENKRKHHPLTAQKQSDGKAKQCHSDQQCDTVGKSCVCGQTTCIFTSYQAARGCDEPSRAVSTKTRQHTGQDPEPAVTRAPGTIRPFTFPRTASKNTMSAAGQLYNFLIPLTMILAKCL